MKSLIERFEEKYIVSPNSCWIWIGATNGLYGLIKIKHKRWLSHRLSYILYVKSIPNNLQLDHLCRNTLCVNWRHLEAVTPRENILRSSGLAAINYFKKFCKNGHEFTVENTGIRSENSNGQYRYCRKCKNVRSKNKRLKGISKIPQAD